MTPDQLELAITHYLDGTLPAEESGALESRLASDPAAQALLDEHKALTAALRSEPLPELDWADLARDLSAVVTGTVGEQSRVEDQALNAILKAATPLPEIRWDALSRRIADAVDAEVAAVDEADGRFDEMLRSASPMPAVNWDRLASHLSDAVAAEAREEQEDERPAVIGRIGWVRTVSSLAVAACVLVATGLGLRSYMGTGGSGHAGGTGGQPVGPAVAAVTTNDKPGYVIDVPTAETAAQPSFAEMSIGPSKEYVASDGGYRNRSPVVILTPAPRPSERQWEESESWMGLE